VIYLDNAATTYPKPFETLIEHDECMRRYAGNAGRGGHSMSIRASEKIYETRELLGDVFNISSPDTIAFTLNATMSINMGLKGVLSDGDNVIITSMEHNSVYRPLVELAKKGVTTTVVDTDSLGFVSPGDIENKITEQTKLICVTHASNVTGAVNNITEIGGLARRKNVLFMVDAAQSAGSVDIDVERDNIDILAFPGHKGLLGLQGTGGIYVKEGINIKTIIEGGTGSQSESPYQPLYMPDRIESGTVNLPGIASLYGGLTYILKRGVKSIADHEKNLAAILYEKLSYNNKVKILSPPPDKNGAGIVAVRLDNMDSAKVAHLLDKNYKIAVRAGFHCSFLAAKTLKILDGGCVRFSVGPFNMINDITKAAEAISDISHY
jgi:cysteine desulfurase/selenocysteine lyase